MNARRGVYFDGIDCNYSTPVYRLDKLDVGDEMTGPAVVIEGTQTIVLVPGARAVVSTPHLVVEVGKAESKS
jgi:5-oxoprolinase (ATP-hydrolysing)